MIKVDQTPRQLKNLFINPNFQLRFMSYFVTLFFLTTISLYSTTFLFFWRIKEKALKVGIPEGHAFFRFLGTQKEDLDALFIGLAILNLLLLLGIGFIISHRIAGPIHKLKKQLEQIDNQPEEFKLRESDFFRELEPLVKELNEKRK